MSVNDMCAPRTKCVFCRATLPASFVEEELVVCPDCINEYEEDADDYLRKTYGAPRNVLDDDYEDHY